MRSLFLYPTIASVSLFFSCNENIKDDRPNILFCIADDISYPHMGIYGTDWIHTPGFDRVAKEGLLFENVYTCNAKSSPSRSCIITGRNSWQLEEACNHWPNFPAKFASYPEILEKHGYCTGGTGKGWGPGIALDSAGKERELVGKMWQQHRLEPLTSGISNIDYAANFREFLKQRPKGKPFCFWYGSLEPHRNYEYGSSLKNGKHINEIDSVPSFWPDNEIVRTDMLDYALEIKHFDMHLNRMLQILEECGELENTIIIATADHGMPFPRCKGQEYEYSNHVPFALMWKKGIKHTGKKIKELISFIDLAPTFLEVAKIEERSCGMAPITGRSFTDILTDGVSIKKRDFILIGKERHDIGRPHDQGYPIRGIIKDGYLFLINFEPCRWPAGNPETGYANVDGGATKSECLKSRKAPQCEKFWQLSFGKREAEELYCIDKDRDCMVNLVWESSLQDIKEEMKSLLLRNAIRLIPTRGFKSRFTIKSGCVR
ncbi:MAG: sulfatase [Bacteroidales bacterium]|nr:sulfatase [Bacteroidales bacterium]